MLRPLGQGNFSKVVEAERIATGERVALKELSRLAPSSLAGFKREFRTLQGLHHPNLVRLDALFEHEQRWFIAMALVQGCDWLQWVRPTSSGSSDNDNGVPFSVERLRSTLGDITHGLQALHHAGLVHRDLKPANIRVTPEGKAVLLDFGLVAATGHTESSVGGTAAYMAPEQAAGAMVGPAADWYALGATLYEALTGRLPFVGPNDIAILMAKQQRLPAPPQTPAGPVPRALEALTMRLLAPVADERGTGLDVLRSVSTERDGADGADGAPQTMLAPTVGAAFTGRSSELDAMTRAFQRALRGECRQVIVEGESGIGKSALVEQFVRQMGYDHPDAVVLRGRCYENESVPFKGVDGIMDELARYLGEMPPEECSPLLPRWAKVLEELFPVMGIVRPLSQGSLEGIPVEPGARRRAAFRAVCELLGAIASRRPLTLIVDDLQWADEESFTVFQALTQQGAVPGLLVLFTVRERDEVPEALLGPLDELRKAPGVQALPLRHLIRSETLALAAQLVGAAVPQAQLARIVDESEGHPLFVAELARHELERNPEDTLRQLSLDDMLEDRLRALSQSERGLIELVACAASPKPMDVIQRTARDAGTSEALAALRAQRFVRSASRARVQCYHDRVRAAVLRGLSPQRLAELHAQWGEALAAEPDWDAAEVGRHFDRAGRADQAAQWLERGAEEALKNLGFAQAAKLYRRCLVLSEHMDDDGRRRCLIGAGHALAQLGKSAEAAECYQQAAPFADRVQAVRLRVWAAQHLLQSAQTEEGLEAARAVLAEVGIDIRMPMTTGSALRTLAMDRLRLKLRGLRFEAKPPEEVSGEARLTLDALQALTAPISFVQMLTGAVVNTKHLVHALKAGDPSHAAKALAGEAFMRVLGRPESFDKERASFDEAASLARDSGDPATSALVALHRGTAAWMAQEPQQAQSLLRDAEELLVRECPGEPWVLTNVRIQRASVWSMLGAHREVADACQRWVREASERGDRFAHAGYVTTAGHTHLLMRDDPRAALRQLAEVMAPWPKEPFAIPHLGELSCGSTIRLYMGGDASWAWLELHRERLERALMLKNGFGRSTLLTFRSNAALAHLSHLAKVGEHGDAVAERSLRKAIKHLDRSATLFRLNGQFFRAQYVALREGAQAALPLARQVRKTWADMGIVHAHGAAYLEGLLVGGEEGVAMRQGALGFFEGQGYVNASATLRMYLPALDGLDARYGS